MSNFENKMKFVIEHLLSLEQIMKIKISDLIDG